MGFTVVKRVHLIISLTRLSGRELRNSHNAKDESSRDRSVIIVVVRTNIDTIQCFGVV